MTVIKSAINPRSDAFKANAAAMQIVAWVERSESHRFEAWKSE